MSWPRGWPYTGSQVHRLFEHFEAGQVWNALGNCILEEFEDALRAWDAAAIRQFRREGWWHWAGAPTIYFPPGRLHHYLAVYDAQEANRRYQALGAGDRHALDFPVPEISGHAWGPHRLETLRLHLHQRANGITDIELYSHERCLDRGSDIVRFRSMQALGERYVSGEEDRIQATGFAIAGAATGRAFATNGLRVSPDVEVPPVQGPARIPGPTTGRTLPGVGPSRALGGRTGQTMPGVGPVRSLGGRTGQTLPGVVGFEPEIGHAPTLPAPPDPARAPTLPAPRSGRTLRGPGRPNPRTGRTMPGVGSTDAPVEIESLEAGVEHANTPAGLPAIQRLPPGGHLEPISEQQARGIREFVPQTSRRPGEHGHPVLTDETWTVLRPDERDRYSQEWRSYGGSGDPPTRGFIVRTHDGEARRVVVMEPEAIPAPIRPHPDQFLPAGATVGALSEEQRLGYLRQLRDGRPPGVGWSQHPPGEDTYRTYAGEWRACGGSGEPPPHGFIIRNPDGSIYRVIAYGRY
jgi:hypothetical protein